MKKWDLKEVQNIIDEYSDQLDEHMPYVHKYFNGLKQRKRYAVELTFKSWAAGVPRDEVYDFKKKIEKLGLYCGFNQNFFTVIISPFPSIVNVLCYVAIPSWENDVVRGLFFGYRPKEINKFMDQFEKKPIEVEKV